MTEHGASDVTVQVSLSYTDGRDGTTSHGWHVHTNTYDGESCASTGGHYNPFNADVSAPVGVWTCHVCFYAGL